MYLHGEADGVHQNEGENGVLKVWRRDQPPDLVLDRRLGDVAPLRLCFQCKFDALPLQKFKKRQHFNWFSLNSVTSGHINRKKKL